MHIYVYEVYAWIKLYTSIAVVAPCQGLRIPVRFRLLPLFALVVDCFS